MAFSVLILLLSVLGADPTAAEQSPPDGATCQLILDGQGIEKLVLERENRGTYTKDVTGPSLWLEPGRYRVLQVTLKGGFNHDARGEAEWFTLSSDEPHHLRAGAPLTPRVDVKRQGRLLNLDYRLVDAAGRRYRNTDRTHPPRFTISTGGQQIASGLFEYG